MKKSLVLWILLLLAISGCGKKNFDKEYNNMQIGNIDSYQLDLRIYGKENKMIKIDNYKNEEFKIVTNDDTYYVLNGITYKETENKETKYEKVDEPIQISQPKEEIKVVETKPESIKEPEPVIPKCSESNHYIGVGNSNKWFNSKQEAINHYQSIIKTWGDKWEKFEIDDETYQKNCPYGYETWSCPLCEKWTINFYYN